MVYFICGLYFSIFWAILDQKLYMAGCECVSIMSYRNGYEMKDLSTFIKNNDKKNFCRYIFELYSLVKM